MKKIILIFILILFIGAGVVLTLGKSYDYKEGFSAIKINDKYGFIDKKGNIVIAPIYNFASSFSEGLAEVRINYKYGFIDTKGNIVISPVYDSTSSFK